MRAMPGSARSCALLLQKIFGGRAAMALRPRQGRMREWQERLAGADPKANEGQRANEAHVERAVLKGCEARPARPARQASPRRARIFSRWWKISLLKYANSSTCSVTRFAQLQVQLDQMHGLLKRLVKEPD
jgi:hypothetical protein